MDFLFDPTSSRCMTVKDAMDIVVFYEKYDFHKGVELCDDVLSEVFWSDSSCNLDEMVNVAALGQDLNLSETIDSAKVWMRSWIGDRESLSFQFTVEHIRRLVPLMAASEEITESLKAMLGKSINIENSTFPAFFVSQFQLIAARNTVNAIVSVIVVTDCEAAGKYEANGDRSIDGSPYYCTTEESSTRVGDTYAYKITKAEGKNWKICKRVVDPSSESILCTCRNILYKCKDSRYAVLPP